MIRILSNIAVPASDNYNIKTFLDYIPELFIQSSGRTGQKHTSLQNLFTKIPKVEFPDAIIINTPEYLPIPDDIQRFSGPKILLITDWNVCIRYLKDVCLLFDYCFTDIRGTRVLKELGLTNIYHQPLFGHNPELFKISDSKPFSQRQWDVTFCGNLTPTLHQKRNRLLSQLTGLGSLYNINISNSYGQDYIRILNDSKTVWNLAIRNEANMRTFEAMACGAVPLIENTNQEVPLLFKTGKHYLNYDENNMIEDIKKHFSRINELETISQQAVKAVASHSKRIQISTLLDGVFHNSIPQSQHLSRVNSFLKPDKAAVKCNYQGGCFWGSNVFAEISRRWQHQPELELEMIPGIIVSGLFSPPNSDQDNSRLVKILESRYFSNPEIPQYIREYLQAQVQMLSGDYVICNTTLMKCINSIQQTAAQKPGLSSFYNYLIPPLRLAEDFNVDLNNVFEKEGNSGNTELLQSLLLDNCWMKMGTCHLKQGNFTEAQNAVRNISTQMFLSANRNYILAQTCPRSGSKQEALEALQNLFEQDPLNCFWWGILFQGYKTLEEHDLFTKLKARTDMLLERVYHQNMNLKQQYHNFFRGFGF